MGNEAGKKIQKRNFDDVCIHHENISSESFSIFISHVKSLKKIAKPKRFCT
jgi:hypothetical protein